MEDGDELVVPLNVLVGGQASPTDSAPKAAPGIRNQESGIRKDKKELESFETHDPELRTEYEEKWRKLLIRTFERQRDSILPKIKSNQIEAIWDAQRWDEELAEDFYPLSMSTSMAWAKMMAARLGISVEEEELKRYLENSARIAAEDLNASTREQVEAALQDEEPKTAMQKVFETLLAVAVGRFAISRVTSLESYGAYKAAVKGGITTKTWVVNSTNPRDEHAAMNGETVGIRDRFSNGLRWPGDYEGSAEQTVHCMCSLRYNRETEQ
jgi:hypothetical protein